MTGLRNEVETLVAEVLHRRNAEHITLHVFLAIELDEAWRERFNELCEDSDTDTVKQEIGRAVRAILGADVIQTGNETPDLRAIVSEYSSLRYE